jgi:hypothetical protein
MLGAQIPGFNQPVMLASVSTGRVGSVTPDGRRLAVVEMPFSFVSPEHAATSDNPAAASTAIRSPLPCRITLSLPVLRSLCDTDHKCLEQH